MKKCKKFVKIYDALDTLAKKLKVSKNHVGILW